MQSRLAVTKLKRLLLATPPKPIYQRTHHAPLFSSDASGATNEGNEMEDAMTQGVDTEGETDEVKPDGDHHDDITPTREDNRYRHPKTVPPNLSSSRLETPGVNTPFDPHVQQKRSKAELTCAGVDGWDEYDDKTESGSGGGRKEEEEDDKEYFDHHKASPLSEIEIVDTRKPVTRVAQGTSDGYFGDEKVLTWRPEQLDTAEESLLRATKIFRESAARGSPELPHSRRLRELRGEDW